MKRFIPLIIILVFLLVAVLVLVHCMRSEQPPTVSESPSLAEPEVLHNVIDSDVAEPGRREQASDGSPGDSMSDDNTDDSMPGDEPDALMQDGDPGGTNVMLGTWHVEAVSNVGEVSLRDTTMTFDEANWSVDGTVTVTIPGVLSFSEGLTGAGTYTYNPVSSMLEFNNETYNAKEISHVEVIDEDTLLITIQEYIGDGELLYDVYMLTRN